MKQVVNINIRSQERVALRNELISEFLGELPGTGKGDLTSQYEYIVEKLNCGNEVYISRPATLNKGFDFTVHVRGIQFRAGRLADMPRHSDIVEDIEQKLKENPSLKNDLRDSIDLLYRCKNVPDNLINALSFKSGHHIEVILYSIKWLFIEQDITYWNWSGRNMFYSKLMELF